jgi:hypothetical protein
MTKAGWRDTALRERVYEEVLQVIEKNRANKPVSVAAFVEQAVLEKLRKDSGKN